MLASTHSIFGLLAVLLVLGIFGSSGSLHGGILCLVLLGAVLPDIDHSQSLVGKFLPFISRPLEERFGHRMFTHSILGCIAITGSIGAIFAFLFFAGFQFAPAGFLNWRLWTGFGIGYFSHLCLDMLNVSGVPLLWPDPSRYVVFKNPQLRFTTGGRIELAIGIFLLLGLLLVLPVSKYGLMSSLRWVLATSGSAVEEYQEADTISFLEFDGYFTATHQPLLKVKARILGVENHRLVILYANNVYSAADSTAADIFLSKARVKRTPLPIRVDKKEFKNCSKEYLLAQVPKEALICGTVYLPPGLQLRLPDFTGSYRRIEQSGQRLFIRYADKKLLTNLNLSSQFILAQEKERVRLREMENRCRLLQVQSAKLVVPLDLTPEGKKVLSKARDDDQWEQMQAELRSLAVQIKEARLNLQSRRLIFSGTVYIYYQ